MLTQDYITIQLSKTGKLAGQYEALVSHEDADLDSWNWTVKISPHHKTQYATHRKIGGRETMHRLILSRILGRPLLPTEQVDHINLNGLDNRRENLRLATHSQNQANGSRYKNNTSGYKGVRYHAHNKKWGARIQVDGKRIFLGLFDTPEEAHDEYCKVAKRYFGDFSNTGG